MFTGAVQLTLVAPSRLVACTAVGTCGASVVQPMSAMTPVVMGPGPWMAVPAGRAGSIRALGLVAGL